MTARDRRPGDDEVRGWAAGTLLASFPGARLPAWVERRAAAGLGGICLYGSNRGADVAAVAARLHALRPELVVALDEEGGDVTRLEAGTGSSVPGNAALGAVDDVALTRSVAEALGGVLRDVGVDLDLAPCADVNSDPANPVIGVRSFGADASQVARHTAAFVDGLQAAGVAACAKHFPGHGDVAVDSHLALPSVHAPAATLRHRELVPFRAAVDAGVAAVMPGHLLVPALDRAPATVSRPIVTGLLRVELGFTGVVVTDALDMGGIGGPDAIPANVVRALAAGADLCCLGPDGDDALVQACIDAVAAAVAAGELSAERLAEAAGRVAGLRAAARGPAPAPPAAGGYGSAAAPGLDAEAAPRAAEPLGPDDGAGATSRPPHGLDAGAPGGRHAVAGRGLARLGAAAARGALRVDGRLPASLAGAHVVELDRPANIAAGAVPWGLGVALRHVDPRATTTRVAEGDDAAVGAALAAATGRPVVVVVRDPQRRPAQAATLARLLAARPDAVVVDMGWPVDPAARPPAAAWITTHGASRASGDAVARLLGRAASAPDDSPATATPGRTARG